jgi:FAD/FMN-containing dehydrogenase
MTTAFVALNSSGDAVRLLAYLRSALADSIEAFELVSNLVFGLVVKHIPGSTLPFENPARWYVLLKIATGADNDRLVNALMAAADEELLLDVIIAKNSAEADKFWKMRHSITEAARAEGKALKHDISVPISRMEDFLQRGDQLLAEIAHDARLFAYGHVGDGNLHYNVVLPAGMDDGSHITTAIYELVEEMGGSFSAEHGIGRLKRQFLLKHRSEGEIELMRTLKRALDPNNILNPGKVI